MHTDTAATAPAYTVRSAGYADARQLAAHRGEVHKVDGYLVIAADAEAARAIAASLEASGIAPLHPNA